MVISIYGDNNYKAIIENKFREIYKDKVVICDFSSIKFNAIIDTEKFKYALYNNSKKFVDIDISKGLNSINYEKLLGGLNTIDLEYKKIVNKIVMNRINKFLKDNKDKIIVLISDNIFNPDFCETSYFKDSDIKILAVNENTRLFNIKNKELFDFVFSDVKDIDVKKMVKI